MIAVIAMRDFRGFIRDGRLPWLGGLALLLLIVSIAVGWRLQSDTAAERAATEEKGYATWVGQGPKNPHSAAHLGMHVFKPEPPLALFDPGLEPFAGQTVWLEAHKQNDFGFRPAQDATGLRRFGDLSAAYVLQLLAPLILVLIGFDALAGEREQGTLRQLASLGVAPSRLLWGKALAIGAAAAALLAPAVVLSLIALYQAAAVGALADNLARLGWIAIGYGLYLGTFLFVTLAVSAAAPRARGALVALLAIWTVATIVVPRAASEAAHAALPTPTRIDFMNALGVDLRAAQNKALEDNFHVKNASQLPMEEAPRALRVDDHAGYVVFDKHYNGLWDLFERQRHLQEWLGLASPLVALRGLSTSMAGVDLAHQRSFATAAESHRRLIQDTMSDNRIAAGGSEAYNYQASPELWAKVPPFRYEGPSSAEALASSWPNLVTLAAGFALSLLAAVVAARHLRPF
ncbi:MAG TPA: ABC transporter permease subunit [Methylosinus sp.]|jgi:ABC-2 type transport system permease protein|uniref:ABC transporter permease subunit n=1 Tax=Methylosinus sp. TaxID=427 RepID=UPI002F9298A3